MRDLFPLTIHATPSRKTVVAIMRGEVAIRTRNAKRVLGMLANIGGSGNESGLSTRGNGRSREGKRLFATMSFKTRAFKTVAFDGDTCDDNVEKGIRRGGRDKIGRAIEMVLGTLGEKLPEMRPDPIRRKIPDEEVDHLAFFEGNSHGDETRPRNLEFANILVEACKILKFDVRYMRAEVKLSSDVNATIKGLESGPDVTGGGRFSARDDGGDNGGDTALDDVLNLRILLPPFTMSFEGGSICSSSDDGCGYYRKGGERVLGTFDETPEPFTLQGSHDGLAPGGVVSRAIEGGDVVEFECHDVRMYAS